MALVRKLKSYMELQFKTLLDANDYDVSKMYPRSWSIKFTKAQGSSKSVVAKQHFSRRRKGRMMSVGNRSLQTRA